MTELLTTNVTLNRPVHHAGATYTEFVMREATIGDQVDAWKPGLTNAQVELAMIAGLCGVPEEVVRKVSIQDYARLQQVVANFPYPPAPPSTATSSALPEQAGAGG